MSDMAGSETNSENNRSGPWKVAEDALLIKVAKKYGARNWDKVAAEIPGRNGKSCRLRWCNQLCPRINRAPFTDWEDAIIVRGQEELGKKWASISKLLDRRTDNAVKNRWNGLYCRGLSTVTNKNVYLLRSRATLSALLKAGPPVQLHQDALESKSCQSLEITHPRTRRRQYGRSAVLGCPSPNNPRIRRDASVNSTMSFASSSAELCDELPRHYSSDMELTNKPASYANHQMETMMNEDDSITTTTAVRLAARTRISATNMCLADCATDDDYSLLGFCAESYQISPCIFSSLTCDAKSEVVYNDLRAGLVERHGWIEASPFSSDLEENIRVFFDASKGPISRS